MRLLAIFLLLFAISANATEPKKNMSRNPAGSLPDEVGDCYQEGIGHNQFSNFKAVGKESISGCPLVLSNQFSGQPEVRVYYLVEALGNGCSYTGARPLDCRIKK